MYPTLREVLGMPGAAWLWAAVLVSGGLFAFRVSVLVRSLGLGRGEERFREVGRRLRFVAVDVLLQPRLRDGIIWPAHLLIFWGFVLFALAFGGTLLKGLLPFLPVPWPEEIGPVRLLLEVWAVLVLLALAAAAVRRYVLRPVGMTQSLDAAAILVLIGGLMVTFLMSSAFQAIAADRAGVPWGPVGAALASGFRRLGVAPETAESLHLAMWWSHVLLVLGFLAYLPSSKHLHLLAAPFSVFLTDLGPKGRLAPEEPAAAGREGLDLRDFTWRELLTPLACAECGRCDRACPAFARGAGLSPQTLVHHLKAHLLEAAPGLLRGTAPGDPLRPLLGGIISPEEVWACTTCYACMDRCPVRNEHLPLIVRMRRFLVAQGKVEDQLQAALTSLTRYENSFGQSPRQRGRWTQGLPFPIKDARKAPVEYLWFVGDYASYDPRLQGVTRSVAALFHAAGLDFGILYEGERNAGNDIRRVGEEGLFEQLAQKNIATLSRCAFKEIVTTDPHTYNTLKNEYPDLGGRYAVSHYSEVLWRVLREGRLAVRNGQHPRATYHDPCYLGRYNDVYEEPRRVLQALGTDLVEMPRHGRTGHCCGAGGGRIWMEDRAGTAERPAENRIREAVALPGVEVFVVACPKDLVMFQDAVKTTGHEQRIVVKDLAELVWDATGQPAKET